ncbi:MAG: hypothetical protein RMI91_13650 [Gemmatales bacterium]|nr:hypothetical protein [Gemmatales bacterium]MDW7995690.1 hypothetical protein [Gemmatales bacterium]
MTWAFLQVTLMIVGPTYADTVGPKSGARLAPYMSIVSVGPNRGQLHCFV